MAAGSISRRGLIRGLGALGCSAAAHPLLTTMSLAAMPGESRLVVIILRGAMDGLDVVQPRGDADFARSRPGLIGDAQDLDGFFSLNAALGDLMPLWSAGELAFVHAVSTPYRDRRSHFDGQDLLEAGTTMDAMGRVRDGWLNRLLQGMPGTGAFAIGQESLKILSGPAPVSSWAPGTEWALDGQTGRLLQAVYHDDPLFADSALEAMDLAATVSRDMAAGGDETGMMLQQMMQAGRGRSERALAAFAADRLRRDSRIAAFSINGWDTHRNQGQGLARALGRLSEAILTLKRGLGDVWGRTAVLALTEFGRTVRENGTGGTDHGTASAVIAAGGALKGGRVLGRWPGLSEADLYDRRDLMPTRDVRAVAGWVMADMFGLAPRFIEGTVFPGLDMGERLDLIA